MKAVALSALLIGFAFMSGSASADNITVQNASFETVNPPGLFVNCGTGCAYNFGPIPGWTTTGVAGQFEPGGVLTGVPDGTTVAYSNGGSISQDLGVDLAPDTTYTLSVWVGDRTDFPGIYSIALDAGTNALCSSGGSTTALTPGGFQDVTCSYTTGAAPFTGDLTIWLTDLPGGQTDFDDVTVTRTPEPTSLMLESLGLLAVAFFGVFWKRKQGVAVE